MSVDQMTMLRWISGNIQKDKFKNEEIPLKIGVAPIDEKMRRVTWDGFFMFNGEQLMN